MARDDLDHCRRHIAEEARLALAAPCPEVAEKHLQLAGLYREQLVRLTRVAAQSDSGASLNRLTA